MERGSLNEVTEVSEWMHYKFYLCLHVRGAAVIMVVVVSLIVWCIWARDCHPCRQL